MEKDLSTHRKFYSKLTLLEKDLPKHPIKLFNAWFDEVISEGSIEEANAMTITTIGLDGFPKGRVVLLKYFSGDGFVFFTNYESEKGQSILNNPNVSLSFFWPSLERQVIIKGKAKKTSVKLSNTYYNSRPRESRLGAWVSNQSEIIQNRDILDNKLKKIQNEYEGKDIPRPKFWGGFIVKPIEVEFWQGRESRLHDRIKYSKKDKNWLTNRLSP